MISLDTSSATTGVAVWENGKLTKYFSLCKPKKENDTNWMSYKILEILSTYNPDIVIVEEAAVSRNMQTVRVLIMLIGVIKGWCISKNVFFDALKPTYWRKQIAGKDEVIPRKRVESKVWAIEKVKLLFNIEEIDDVCEAILVGQAYINITSQHIAFNVKV